MYFLCLFFILKGLSAPKLEKMDVENNVRKAKYAKVTSVEQVEKGL